MCSKRLDRLRVLGRGTLAGLDLGDPMVLRSHAVVSPTARGWEVADLDSGNGTFLNGHALGVAMCRVDGYELRLGDEGRRCGDNR